MCIRDRYKQDNSVETQKNMSRSFSKIHGIKTDDYFIDFGISGKETTKWQKYNELMELVNDSKILPLLLLPISDGLGILLIYLTLSILLRNIIPTS